VQQQLAADAGIPTTDLSVEVRTLPNGDRELVVTPRGADAALASSKLADMPASKWANLGLGAPQSSPVESPPPPPKSSDNTAIIVGVVVAVVVVLGAVAAFAVYRRSRGARSGGARLSHTDDEAVGMQLQESSEIVSQAERSTNLRQSESTDSPTDGTHVYRLSRPNADFVIGPVDEIADL
jgi:hypothetical protein